MKLLLILSIALFQAEGTNAQSSGRLAEEGAHSVSSTSSVELSRNFNKTVVPITKLQSYGAFQVVKFGTGFCIDPGCRFVGTNYHVAKAMGKHFKIEGSPVVNRWMGTGPKDEEATDNKQSFLLGIKIRAKYALIRDVAIVELRWPLSRKGYHGVTMYDADLKYGQAAYIYAFPLNWNPKRRLEKFKAKFLGYNVKNSKLAWEDLSDKPLVFDYDQEDGRLRGGASGGIVIDEQGRIIGILNALASDIDHTITAVPVHSFADFLSRVQPYLSTQLFPKSVVIPPASADSYPEWVPVRYHTTYDCGGQSAPCILQKRPAEPPEIQALRQKATVLADSMRNFIAVQSFEWGKGDRSNPPEAIAQFEVRVIDGYQRFREYPDGTKEFQGVPFPAPLNTAIATGGEWAEMPDLVGNNLKLRINHAPDVMMNGETFQVFQWAGQVEDGICKFKTIVDLVFLSRSKVSTLNCYGEVWTDNDLNLVRASENYKLLGTWKNYHGEVTFGVVTIGDHSVRVPMTIATQAEYGGKLYWCQGIFSDYHEFASDVKIGSTAMGALMDGANLDQRLAKPQ
ncbi:MAG: serine protease [Candidatus Acidiferrum sp.]